MREILIERYKNERDEALKGLDIKKFKKFYKKWWVKGVLNMRLPKNDEEVYDIMCRMVVMLVDFDEETTKIAREYVKNRNTGCEVECFVVGIGCFNPFAIGKEKVNQDRVINLIKGLEGLMGVTPLGSKGTALVFDTENHAKVAKNILNENKVRTGKDVSRIFVAESDLKRGHNEA